MRYLKLILLLFLLSGCASMDPEAAQQYRQESKERFQQRQDFLRQKRMEASYEKLHPKPKTTTHCSPDGAGGFFCTEN